MITLSQLRDLKRSEFEEAADGWGDVSSRAGAARTRVDNEITAKLHDTQKGEAANQAMAKLDTLSQNYHYIHTECGLIRTVLNGLAEELEAPQRKLKQALEDAKNLKFTVHDDGSVDYPRSPSTPAPLLQQPARDLRGTPPLLNPGGTDPNQAKAQAIADHIGQALREANEIDGRYARVLAKLGTGKDLDNTDWVDVAQDLKDVRAAAGKHFRESDIPRGKSPKENAAWWSGLSQEQRDEYVSLYPASIGALDGLPAIVRDDANRTVMRAEKAEITYQLAALRGHPPTKYQQKYNNITGLPLQGVQEITPQWKKWEEQIEDLEKKKAGIETINRRIAETGERGLPEAYLLGFDTKGRGHAIIATGNPDRAENTAVYVPGTGACLADIHTGLSRTEKLWRTSSAVDPRHSVSTIAWYGYDAPQDVKRDSPYSHYANDAAGATNQFFAGLRTSHDPGVEQHLTAVAHSYGTVVVGSAARQGHLPVDDVVFAGSPGAQVGRATDMDVPKGHVWNERAQGDDLVGTLGQFSHGHREWHWKTGVDFVVPSDARFGANQMATDTEGHGGYWDYDEKKDAASLSIKNQAKVIMGRYDEVAPKK